MHKLGLLLIALVLLGAGCSSGKTENANNKLEEARRICLGLPHSSIPGNDVKNYVACMLDHEQTPIKSDLDILDRENPVNNSEATSEMRNKCLSWSEYDPDKRAWRWMSSTAVAFGDGGFFVTRDEAVDNCLAKLIELKLK